MCALVISPIAKMPRLLHGFNICSFLKKCVVNQKNSCRTLIKSARKIDNSFDVTVQPYISFKILRLIKTAIREYGPIVEENKKLASLLTKAEQYNVPYDSIDHAQKAAVDNRAKAGIFEMLYLNHGFFVIQYEIVDISLTKHTLLKMCNKYDAYLVSGSSKWMQYFDLKAMVCVEDTPTQPIANKKEAEKIASKVGAKFVEKEIDLNDWISWQFCCEPGDLHKVKKLLQKENYHVDEAYVGFLPKQKFPLPLQVKRMTYSIISELNKIPAIENLYHNIRL